MKDMATKLEIELDDGERRVMKLIKQAHQEKSTIACVRIEYWGEEGGIIMSHEQFQDIFTCLGSFPNLQDAILHFTHDAPPLPVQALQQLIFCHVAQGGDDDDEEAYDEYDNGMATATRRLEYLSLHRVKLQGTLSEFAALGDCLKRNESLNKIHLSGCSSIVVTAEEDESSSTTTMDGQGMDWILEALGNMALLETVHLDAIDHLSASAFTAICQSQSIHKMELWNMADDLNRHGPAIAKALSTRQSQNHNTGGGLHELEISSNLQRPAGNAMIEMLHCNTTLDSIGLDLEYAEYGEPLSQVLLQQPACDNNNNNDPNNNNSNASLKTLHLRLVADEEEESAIEDPPQDHDDATNDGTEPDAEGVNDSDSDNETTTTSVETATLANAKMLLTALESNDTLEHLHMNFYHISPDDVQSTLIPCVEQLLQINFVLKDLTLRGRHDFTHLSDKARFGLRLNRAGRYELLLGGNNNNDGGLAPRTKWIDTIAAHQQEVDIVFYLLSTNPSLCCTAATTTTTATKAE
ncbi:expressed unknown protein [Seminavis robusta]|uniref:Uncharacterized protein n=1 Tax=Seminavis robusta TaxID=568900 RepID=A0A9N8DJD4_9STRA|nr:expressed unknown protein [Seminavis robusta]|eukprot:Sro176_g077220.1 n/a (523) ;mRNA; r:10354-11922